MNYRLYVIISGALFCLITIGQLTRLSLQLPVRVGEWDVPLWPSMIVVVVAATLFVWAMRLCHKGDEIHS